MTKIWKDLPSSMKLSKYQISTYGQVRNKITQKILNYAANEMGYIRVKLYRDDGKPKKYQLSRLVAYTFCEKKNEDTIADHINHKRNDNCIKNIRWVDSSGNNNNRIRTTYGARRNIVKFNKNNQNIEKIYGSISQACQKENINYSTIKKYIKNVTTVKGYIFGYKEDYIKLDNEEWKLYNEQDKTLFISNMGRVKYKNGRITKGNLCNFTDKYYKTIGHYGKTIRVHRMVMIAFNPRDDQYNLQVDHLNEDKTDNRLCNLEWVTPKINTERAVGHKIHKLNDDLEIIATFNSKSDAAASLGKERKYASKLTVAMNKGYRKWGYYWKCD